MQREPERAREREYMAFIEVKTFTKSKNIHHIDSVEKIGGGGVRQSSLRGRERAIVNQTNIGTVSKATLGKLLRETGWSV